MLHASPMYSHTEPSQLLQAYTKRDQLSRTGLVHRPVVLYVSRANPGATGFADALRGLHTSNFKVSTSTATRRRRSTLNLSATPNRTPHRPRDPFEVSEAGGPTASRPALTGSCNTE
eukprot:5180637-Prymnesium_polylepis.2